MDAYLEPLVEPERFAFYQAVCEFADNDIAPELLTWERQHSLLPEKVIRAIADLGLFGLTVAEEYGGQGGTQLDLVLMGLALGAIPGLGGLVGVAAGQDCVRGDR
jgi:alkylation response protein AidB-like acyl-CoA dehydrogenase